MTLRIKSPRDIEQMRRAGALLWRLLDESIAAIGPGMTTSEFSARFEDRARQAGAEAIMRGAGFPAAISVCINEEAVHGIPGPRLLRSGDVVTADAAIRLDGWCADMASCTVVDAAAPEGLRLVAAAREVLDAAVAAVEPGRRWSDVVAAAQAAASRVQATILPFCGHGIGSEMHEAPSAGFVGFAEPGGGNRTSGGQDFILRPGLVLTIEPVVTLGRPDVRALDDGWTEVLVDRSAAAHEERTVAVTRCGAHVLTAP